MGIKSVKLMYMYFLENLLYSGAWFRQTKYIVMMTKEGSTKIITFIKKSLSQSESTILHESI